MSAQPRARPADSHRTLLIYCPYDHRITRFLRQGPSQEFECAECGRSISSLTSDEGVPEQIEAQPTMAMVRDPGAIGSTRRTAPFAPRAAGRARGAGWLALCVVVLAGLAALLFALHLATTLRPDANPAAADSSVPVSAQAATESAPTMSVYVGNTDGVGAFVRRTPNLDDHLSAWPDGTRLDIIGPDQTANGLTWENVRAPDGSEGWIPTQYTVQTPPS